MKKNIYLLFLLFCIIPSLHAEEKSYHPPNNFSVSVYPLVSLFSGFSILPFQATWTHKSGHGIKAFYNHSFNHELIQRQWMGLGYRRVLSKHLDAAWFNGINIHYMQPIIQDEYAEAIAITYEIGREKSFKSTHASMSIELGLNIARMPTELTNGNEYEAQIMLYSFFQGIGWRL